MPRCKEENETSLRPACRTCQKTACRWYWEARLKLAGLTMDSGHDRSNITYGHMIENFGELEGKIVYSPPDNGERTESDGWVTTE